MAQQPHDDLFEGPSMSFGEHLEELRVCLFKSILGIIIGVGIGLVFANSVVRFFQSPLERALRNYYIKLAVEDLKKTEFKDGVPIEILYFIEHENYLPQRVNVDLGQFTRAIGGQYPGLLPQQAVSSYGYSERDFKPGGLEAIVTSLASADGKDSNASAKRLRSLLNEDERKSLDDIFAKNTWNPDERRAAIIVLNRLIDDDALHSSAEFKPADAPAAATASPTKPTKPTTETAAAALALHAQMTPLDNTRRQNMRAIYNAFEQDLNPPMLNTTEVWLWKKIEVIFQALNAQEAFMIWMKAALVTGVAIASPWIFYQLWLFVAAGLYRHEKGYVYIYLPMSLGLFFAGAALAFGFVFDPVLQFLFDFQQGMNAKFEPRIGEWMSFVLILPLGFGVSFQLPLVMLFLNRIGIVETATWTANWRVAILSIFVIAMVLTPADPVSMLLMAVPLCFLYVLGIAMCHWMPRGRSPFAEAYEPT